MKTLQCLAALEWNFAMSEGKFDVKLHARIPEMHFKNVSFNMPKKVTGGAAKSLIINSLISSISDIGHN